MADTDVSAFARRLQEWANRRGFTSGRSRSGVDVVKLAEAVGSSYEMARRYADGLAMPKPDGVRAIARWLRISPTFLAYGEGEPEDAGIVDSSLLEQCLRAVTEAQRSAGVELSTDRLAQLVAALYREACEGSAPSSASVAAALRVLKP